MKSIQIFLLGLLLISSVASVAAQGGAHITEFEDDDGDQVILMESQWISILLMPGAGSTVIRFTFRPTQNEIVELMMPKMMAIPGGGGLLQDNLWEQDWRYQELRGKWYDYQITKSGPDEVQVVFETELEGWINRHNSGLKSRLLEGLMIRRTVTLQANTPYFLFDVELINAKNDCAKLPLYWCHNSSLIAPESGDHVYRPSEIGVQEIPGAHDFVYNFNKGWSARLSPERREGLVYLMDYDYLSFLYNCGTATAEWVYDNLLVLKDRPVKTRIHILPIMGLTKVDHANPYFVAAIDPQRDAEGKLRLSYKLTAGYEKASRITLVPRVVHNLLGSEDDRKELVAPSMTFTELGVEPQLQEVTLDETCGDPFVVRTKAFIQRADGTQKEEEFEIFHAGTYSFGRNIRRDLKTPVAKLKRRPQSPFVPTPGEDVKVNQKDFNVFALLGNNSRYLGVEEAVRSIPNAKLEVGYHPGFEVARTGLTDFPYDFDRLYNHRVFVFNNTIFDTARYVGMSILLSYVERGGGMVYGGGDNVLGMTKINANHEIYKFLPLETNVGVARKTVQLNSPQADHPIFKGVDLSNLPYAYFYQTSTVREGAAASTKVLLKAGDQPFIIEYAPKPGQRVMLVLAVPYGTSASHPNQPAFFEWSEWQKLYANVVRYAGHDLQ